MSTKQEIIIRYFREGYSERRIARELPVSRKTVHSYIEDYRKARDKLADENVEEEALIESLVQAPTYNAENRVKRKLTEEVASEIDQLLLQNQQKQQRGLHKQIMKKKDIHEYLRNKGYDIGYTSVCIYISSRENVPKEAYIRQTYAPGEICEFDWGEVKLEINGEKRALQLAAFTPAMSNYRYGFLFNRQDSVSFQQAHVNFIDHVGGVYHTMVYDNMRVVIRRFVGGSQKEPTEALLKLSMYYQFHYRFCNIRRGNEKGHVERSIEYIRRKAFCNKDRFDSLDQANEWLQKVCIDLNTRFNRLNQGKRAVDLLAIEKDHLYPAPSRFDCGEMEQYRVDKYSVITHGTNRYSVPDDLVGKILDVKVYPEKLVCYHENRKICQHERRNNRFGWYINLDHYLNTLRVKPGALAGSVALQSAPENIKLVFKKYFVHTPRDFIELLLFIRDKGYSFDKVNASIARLELVCPHDISADKIKSLCLQNPEQPNHPELNENDQILKRSRQQLQELTMLLES